MNYFAVRQIATHSLNFEKLYMVRSSVADPSPVSGAFLTPGSGLRKKSISGSGVNNPDHISESLEIIFFGGVKILKFFEADPGWKKIGSGWKKFGSGMYIPDPQHW